MRISSKQYAQTLYDLTDGKSKQEIEKTARDFACYLHKERKLKTAEKIIEQFAAVYNKEKGIIEAEVVTREKMDEGLEKKIKHFLKEKYPPADEAGQAKEVILKNSVGEDIKGGLILKVGDEVVDGSLLGRLGELKKILVK
jgi:F-type H+-transporting ATPase subunit delta